MDWDEFFRYATGVVAVFAPILSYYASKRRQDRLRKRDSERLLIQSAEQASETYQGIIKSLREEIVLVKEDQKKERDANRFYRDEYKKLKQQVTDLTNKLEDAYETIARMEIDNKALRTRIRVLEDNGK